MKTGEQTISLPPRARVIHYLRQALAAGVFAPGDQLLLLADTEQGIALPPKAQAGQIFAAITAAMPKRKDDKA